MIVSPICHNHHLIIPNLEKCYNQVWRDELTIDLLTMAASSERADYILYFNSLGGFSSVNHLHVASSFPCDVVPGDVRLIVLCHCYFATRPRSAARFFPQQTSCRVCSDESPAEERLCGDR